MPVKPPRRIKLTKKELKALQGRIKERRLEENDWQIVESLAETVECLNQALDEKNTSLGRLCKYLLGAPTETAKNIIKHSTRPSVDQPGPKPRGHGRNAAASYSGGDRVVMDHPTLHKGDLCPECARGKVYELAMPSVFVQIVGQAPLKATVYERARLRCNLCGEIFTPELPEGIKDQKFDDSAMAMLALLKYGCGMPLYRLENLQKNLGNPLPASTQWDILNAAGVLLSPVYDALIERAAQGEIIHNDDTTMKVLSFLKERDSQSERKGIFTTGIVSLLQDKTIALFKTGDQHAGENLTDLLKQRAYGLVPPIQMCDALSRNVSKDFETILSNCLTHARRQFVEIIDRFPEECTHVIEALGVVYHHEALAKEQNLTAEQRLLYHQEQSGAVMAELKSWCNRQLEEKQVEPNSGLGKAVRYLLNHWEKLTRFLQVAGAPLDNNLCERILKRAILHRKNALFYKTRRGAYVGDLFMSLIHTCQLAGINPLDYLTWLLKNAERLTESPHEFLPWNYGGESPGT